jgi:hypothetical protein
VIPLPDRSQSPTPTPTSTPTPRRHRAELVKPDVTSPLQSRTNGRSARLSVGATTLTPRKHRAELDALDVTSSLQSRTDSGSARPSIAATLPHTTLPSTALIIPDVATAILAPRPPVSVAPFWQTEERLTRVAGTSVGGKGKDQVGSMHEEWDDLESIDSDDDPRPKTLAQAREVESARVEEVTENAEEEEDELEDDDMDDVKHQVEEEVGTKNRPRVEVKAQAKAQIETVSTTNPRLNIRAARDMDDDLIVVPPYGPVRARSIWKNIHRMFRDGTIDIKLSNYPVPNYSATGLPSMAEVDRGFRRWKTRAEKKPHFYCLIGGVEYHHLAIQEVLKSSSWHGLIFPHTYNRILTRALASKLDTLRPITGMGRGFKFYLGPSNPDLLWKIMGQPSHPPFTKQYRQYLSSQKWRRGDTLIGWWCTNEVYFAFKFKLSTDFFSTPTVTLYSTGQNWYRSKGVTIYNLNNIASDLLSGLTQMVNDHARDLDLRKGRTEIVTMVSFLAHSSLHLRKLADALGQPTLERCRPGAIHLLRPSMPLCRDQPGRRVQPRRCQTTRPVDRRVSAMSG